MALPSLNGSEQKTPGRGPGFRAALLGAVGAAALAGALANGVSSHQAYAETAVTPAATQAPAPPPCPSPTSSIMFATQWFPSRSRSPKTADASDSEQDDGRTGSGSGTDSAFRAGRSARALLQAVRRAGHAASVRSGQAAYRAGAGLRIHHFARRLCRDQQSRRREGDRRDLDHRRRQDAHAKVVGTDKKTDLALLKVTEPGSYPHVNFADADAARRRLGDRGRQSVRPRRHRHRRHRLGARPRHRRRAL